MITKSRIFYKPLSRNYANVLGNTRVLLSAAVSSFGVSLRGISSGRGIIKSVLSESEFLNIIKAPDFPVIVDFYAEWCGPCKLLAPRLVEAVKEDERYDLFKVNIDDFPEATKKYQIMSVPSVYAFYKGEPLKYFIGFQNTPGIKKFLEEVAVLAKQKNK